MVTDMKASMAAQTAVKRTERRRCEPSKTKILMRKARWMCELHSTIVPVFGLPWILGLFVVWSDDDSRIQGEPNTGEVGGGRG
jgi:hypothetical protein